MRLRWTLIRLATTPAPANTSHHGSLGYGGGGPDFWGRWYREMVAAGHRFDETPRPTWAPPRASKPRKRTVLQGLDEIARVQRRIGPRMFVPPNPFGGGPVPGPDGYWVGEGKDSAAVA